MNSKSGQDIPSQTEQNAPSPAPLSKECMPLNVHPVETNLSSKLPAETGGLPVVKKAIKSELIKIAEETSDAALSDESKAILERFVDNATRGFVSTAPMRCTGEKCPYLASCPLKQAGSKLPFGKACPVEHTIAALHITKHLQALNIENIDDVNHSFDMDMLCELAGLELIRWRCGAELSKTPSLIVSQAVGGTMDGELIYQDIVNPILEVLDKTGKHIGKLREGLLATRKAQAEVGKIVHDPSQKAAALRAQAEQAKINRLQKLKDAEFKVIDNNG